MNSAAQTIIQESVRSGCLRCPPHPTAVPDGHRNTGGYNTHLPTHDTLLTTMAGDSSSHYTHRRVKHHEFDARYGGGGWVGLGWDRASHRQGLQASASFPVRHWSQILAVRFQGRADWDSPHGPHRSVGEREMLSWCRCVWAGALRG